MLKQWVSDRLWVRMLWYAYDNWRSARRLEHGDIGTESGMAHDHGDLERSLAYIEEVFQDYKRYAGVSHFHGRVAEIGPGDNCGVALLFLGDGCEAADLADRFRSHRDPRYQAGIYRELFRRHPQLGERLGKVDFADERSFAGITHFAGPSAAAERFFDAGRSYDFIVSRAVLEHVYDPELALKNMVAALRPGGMLLHKVDLRDHGMFSGIRHELKFFEISDRIYPHLTRAAGRPNRILIDRYRAALQREPVDFRLLVTQLAGVGEIAPHVPYADIDAERRQRSLQYVRSVRARFAASLRGLSDEDLSVSGFFLVATRR